jgi:hypothetical protein
MDSAALAPPSDTGSQETEWEGPPAMLPDGRGPWMEGPDAPEGTPSGRPERRVLRTALWVLAGIALGAAIWAAIALLSDSDLLAAGHELSPEIAVQTGANA